MLGAKVKHEHVLIDILLQLHVKRSRNTAIGIQNNNNINNNNNLRNFFNNVYFFIIRIYYNISPRVRSINVLGMLIMAAVVTA